jgi:hypothetical protein
MDIARSPKYEYLVINDRDGKTLGFLESVGRGKYEVMGCTQGLHEPWKNYFIGTVNSGADGIYVIRIFRATLKALISAGHYNIPKPEKSGEERKESPDA